MMKNLWWVLVLGMSIGTALAQDGYGHNGTVLLPSRSITPGLTRPDATMAQLCDKKFRTKKYRHTTKQMKDTVYREYGAVKKWGTCCEVDHLVPLELGGVDDLSNLWPQPYQPVPGAKEKDKLEDWLKREVCIYKTMALADAQEKLEKDWFVAYQEMLKTPVREK